jgi:2-polyprenyl-3-methyl-5-hydroxy-6-metoxy-1,4-benzoquinol methylase
MTKQEEMWDEQRAQSYAKQMQMGSRVMYAPFARKIVGCLAPLEREATIVDLGAGPGLLSIQLHKLWPQAKIIGVDVSSEMLEIAKKNADKAGMSNYETRLGRAGSHPVFTPRMGESATGLLRDIQDFEAWRQLDTQGL